MLYQLSYAGPLLIAIAHSDKRRILPTGKRKRKSQAELDITVVLWVGVKQTRFWFQSEGISFFRGEFRQIHKNSADNLPKSG
jgi:hypothetical protein